MELVMFTQLYAGMRGLGHVYRAVGDFLPALRRRPTVAPTFAPGWAPDPEAFQSGLDLSTREMTPADRQNLDALVRGEHRLRADVDRVRAQVPPRVREGEPGEVGGRDPHAPEAVRAAPHDPAEHDDAETSTE